MDLKLLGYFQRVAETGNLTKAAAQIGISQPALTRHILRFEHELGVKLLVRDTRGVSLTDAGRLVIGRSRDLLERAKLVEDELAQLRGEATGEVTICMPSSFHDSVTRPLVREVRQALPNVRLRVLEGFNTQLYDHLDRHEADVGIIMYDYERNLGGVNVATFRRDRLMLLGRPGALKAGETIGPEALSTLDLIMPGPRNLMRLKVEAMLEKGGLVSNVVVEAETTRLINDLVRDGVGYSITPEMSGCPVGLATWPLLNGSIEWAFATLRRREASFAVQQVFEAMKKIISGHFERVDNVQVSKTVL